MRGKAGGCARVTAGPLFTFMHWKRKWQPTPVFLPGEPHGQRSLAGYRPQGCKELDRTDVTEHSHTAQVTSVRATFGNPDKGTHMSFSHGRILCHHWNWMPSLEPLKTYVQLTENTPSVFIFSFSENLWQDCLDPNVTAGWFFQFTPTFTFSLGENPAATREKPRGSHRFA